MIIFTMVFFISVTFSSDTLYSNIKVPQHKSFNVVKIIAHSMHKIYQKYITDLDSERCKFSPSCSDFSRQAFEKTNSLSAFAMTADRLLRDNSFADRYYSKDDKGKLKDDVERYLKCGTRLQSP